MSFRRKQLSDTGGEVESIDVERPNLFIELTVIIIRLLKSFPVSDWLKPQA